MNEEILAFVSRRLSTLISCLYDEPEPVGQLGRNIIWMTVDPAPLPAGRVSAAALADLLKKNDEIGPMFFSINGNRLRLSYPVPNDNRNTGKVKAYVEAVVNEVLDTHDLWDSKALGGY